LEQFRTTVTKRETTTDAEPLRALAINCTLKSGSAESSTELLLSQVINELAKHGVASSMLRAVNLDIKPGITSDEGPGDQWPTVRARIIESDIIVLGTPIWLGQPSSVVKRVLERMDAFLGEADDEGRYPSYGKVGLVAVVGNEDGAHHVSAELFQAMNEVGFTIAASAATYWVGEAMHATDYKDLPEVPDATRRTTSMSVRNSVHLARLLKKQAYPGDR
jgi:multimeric flavodoxin WrbA